VRFPFSFFASLTSFWELCRSILLQLNFHAIWAFRTATGTTTRTRVAHNATLFSISAAQKNRSTERNAIFNTISLCRANNRLRVCHCVSTWHRKRWRLKTTDQTPSKAPAHLIPNSIRLKARRPDTSTQKALRLTHRLTVQVKMPFYWDLSIFGSFPNCVCATEIDTGRARGHGQRLNIKNLVAKLLGSPKNQ